MVWHRAQDEDRADRRVVVERGDGLDHIALRDVVGKADVGVADTQIRCGGCDPAFVQLGVIVVADTDSGQTTGDAVSCERGYFLCDGGPERGGEFASSDYLSSHAGAHVFLSRRAMPWCGRHMETPPCQSRGGGFPAGREPVIPR